VRAVPDPGATPPPVDVERYRTHPGVHVSAAAPEVGERGHWVREWDGDSELAALLS
jgi:hypothetical protein